MPLKKDPPQNIAARAPIRSLAVSAALLAIAALYVAFIVLDAFYAPLYHVSAMLKYMGVLFCFVLACLLRRSAYDEAAWKHLAAALGLTLVADALLLFTPQYLAGLLVFCAAHIVYIRRNNRRAARNAVMAIAAVAAAGCAFLPQAEGALGLPSYYFAAVVYAALILTNTACAFFAKAPQKNRALMLWGMTLFLLCDVCVALYQLLPPGGVTFRVAGVLMWVFYLPAQVLLALSAARLDM
ncbi:MAG: lysoplasmalogenase [Clostridiales bacterium]|jgi:hypothetical protein|nr:lysoplasmalogenase [Clostridiales bacterium]